MFKVTNLSTIGNIASTKMEEVTTLHRIILVDEEDEDKRKLLKFASKRIHHYNPKAGYGYYEFTKPAYILPERNVIARNQVMCMDMK